MASQTVMTLCSSFTPKLATFNSPTSTLLPLSPRSFSCFSSLPTPRLKASYGGIRALNTSNFKCYGASDLVVHAGASAASVESGRPGDEEVQALGRYAVVEYNREYGAQFEFQRVMQWARKAVVGAIEYSLLIEVKLGPEAKILNTKVSFGPYTQVPIGPSTT